MTRDERQYRAFLKEAQRFYGATEAQALKGMPFEKWKEQRDKAKRGEPVDCQVIQQWDYRNTCRRYERQAKKMGLRSTLPKASAYKPKMPPASAYNGN